MILSLVVPCYNEEGNVEKFFPKQIMHSAEKTLNTNLFL